MSARQAVTSMSTPAQQRSALEAKVARLEARVRELERDQQEDQPARLEHFAEAMGGWFWEMDENLRFTYFSASVERITGVAPEWHYGKTREELGKQSAISDGRWREHLAALERHEPFDGFVFHRVGPDGLKWMKTSGMPVFDEQGTFRGYRGTATDSTAEVEARRTSEQLLAAVQNFDELFALWDANDQLVMCNERFREVNAPVAETLAPGTPFEAHIRGALAAGLYPQAAGREEQWLAQRFSQHHAPGTPFELERQDGRWLLIREHRLPDGSTATISADITERKRWERELAEKHRVLETALETIPDGVQVLDDDLKLVAWNARLWEVLQLDGEAITSAPDSGKAFRYALASRGEYGEGDVDALVASREAIARSPVPIQYERQLVTGRWIECRGAPVPGGGYLAVYRDIDQRKHMESELHRMATRDELTGLPNRRSLIETLESELERQRRYARPLSLLLMDLDHFKAVNDQHGHPAGDTVLRFASKVMHGVLRDVDTVGRLGGEEFAAVLPETDLASAARAAERVRAAVAALKIESDDTIVQITVSVGVTTVCSGDTAKDILARADRALYDAKAAGRDQVIVHST